MFKKLLNKIKKENKNLLYIFLIVVVILLCILLGVVLYFKLYLKKQNEFFENNNEKIIVPDLIGGIGNQLFIFASAFVLSKKLNLPITFDNRKDIYSYGENRRTYNDVLFYNFKLDSNLDKNKITSDTTNTLIINENDFQEIINNKQNIPDEKKIMYITGGYYQEYSYFNDYRNELLDVLKPHPSTIEKVNQLFKENNIKSTDKLIGIHFRMIDKYTPDTPNMHFYSEDEYDLIINDLDKFPTDSKFIVISNDLNECKNKFNSRNIQIDKSRIIYLSSEDYVELAILSKCHEYVASPSTFCWWGIYLNPMDNKEKKIHIYWNQNSDYRQDFYKKYKLYPNLINKYYTITCVSGFWNVKNKYSHNYNEWFKNTLAINAPYIFFSSNETKDFIKNSGFRKSFETHYIEKNINDFKTYNLNMKNETHNIHVPSKEIGLIWLEKINLLQESANINPFGTEWFAWIDSGICIYRDQAPPMDNFPNIKKLNLLAKDKLNYCTSEKDIPDNGIINWEYTHNISGNFIIHISLIPKIHKLFYDYLNKCISENNSFVCYSEQVILSRIFHDNPQLFNKISSGYGNIFKDLS